MFALGLKVGRWVLTVELGPEDASDETDDVTTPIPIRKAAFGFAQVVDQDDEEDEEEI